MRLYDSLEMFDIGLSHVRKWMRCGQAIRQSTHLPLDTAYSLGDSLTFWAVPAGALADDRYVGHRRYHTVLSPIDEPLAVYVRPKRHCGQPVHTATFRIANGLACRMTMRKAYHASCLSGAS